MQVYVYKSEKQQDHFLYLGGEIADSNLPEALTKMLGELSLVIEFELTKDRKLPQAEVQQVFSDIHEQGFYLQMPKRDMRAEEDRVFN
jgi:uncharacterized protein YcgL (UPF0745 family)